MVSTKLEEEYYRLRQKLDEFKYKEPFRPDSMPLVEHLFQDLVLTTESYREAKEKMDVIDQKYKETYYQVEPLKKQVRALVEENNQLHKQIIQLVDGRDEAQERLVRQVKKLEGKVADLTFLKEHMLKQWDQEKFELEQKLLFRHELDQVSARLGSGRKSKSSGKLDSVNASGNNMNGNGNYSGASIALTELWQPKIDLDSGLKALQSPLPSIKYDPVMIDMTSLLEKQIETLLAEKKALASETTNARDTIASLQERIKIRDVEIDRLSRTLEEGLSSMLRRTILSTTANNNNNSGNSREVEAEEESDDICSRLQSQIDYLQEQLTTMDRENTQIKMERNELFKQIQRERSEFEAAINKEKNSNQGLLRHVESMERAIKEISGNPSSGLNIREKSRDSIKSNENIPLVNKINDRIDQGTETTKTAVSLSSNSTQTEEYSNKSKGVQELNETIQELQEELKATEQLLYTSEVQRNLLQEQVKQSRETIRQLKREQTKPQNIAAINVEVREQAVQTLEMENEKNSLSQRVLLPASRERNIGFSRLNSISTQTMQDKSRTVASSFSQTDSLSFEQPIQQQNEERNADNSNQLNSGNNNSSSSDQQHLNDLLKNVYLEKERLESKYLELMGMSDMMKKELEETRRDRDRYSHELSTKQQLYQNLEQVLEKVHERRVSSDLTLENTTEEMSKLFQNLKLTSQERDQLEDSCRDLNAKMLDMQAKLEILDRERDKHNAELDSKDEQIAELNHCLEDLIKELKDQQQVAESLHQNQLILNSHVSDQEKEISSLKNQLNVLGKERNQSIQQLQENLDQIQRLGADNRSLSKENEALQSDLSQLMKQNNEGMGMHEELLSKINFLEDLCQAKEQEREMVMNAYRNLCSESASIKDELKAALDEQVAFKARESELLATLEQLGREYEMKQTDVETLKASLASAEQQCEYLGSSLATAQNQILSLQGSNSSTLQDLESVRHLAQEFDMGRDEARKQISRLQVELDQASKKLNSLEREKSTLLATVTQESSARDRLEQLLIGERTKVMRLNMEVEALRTENTNSTSRTKSEEDGFRREREALLEQLALLKRENEGARERMGQMDRVLREQQNELMLLRRESEIHHQQEEEQTEFKPVINNNNDDDNNVGARSQSVILPSEKRILSDLQRTKSQMSYYDELIQRKVEENQRRHIQNDGMKIAQDVLSEWQNSTDKLANQIVLLKDDEKKSTGNGVLVDQALSSTPKNNSNSNVNNANNPNNSNVNNANSDNMYLRDIMEQVKRDLKAALVNSPVITSTSSSANNNNSNSNNSEQRRSSRKE